MAERAYKAAICTIFTIACVIAALVLAMHAQRRENILDLIPIHDEVISDYAAVSENFGQSKILFFCVNSDANSPECAEWLESELERTAGLKPLIPKQHEILGITSTALRHAPAVFTSADAAKIDNICSADNLAKRMKFFAEKLSSVESPAYKKILLDDPAGLSALFFDKLAAENKKNCALSTPKKALFAMEGSFSSADSEQSRILISKVRAACLGAQEKFPGVGIAYSGAYRVSADNAEIAESDTSLCLKLSAFLMLILCLLAFNNKACAFAALLPSMSGTAIALAISSLALNELSTISIAFASIAIGVGIDYAIHLIYALKSAPDSYPYGLIRPVSAAAGTTLIAFLTMCALGSKGFFQIGFFGAISVFSSAILSFLMLPGMIPGGGDGRPTPFERLAQALILALKRTRKAIIPAILTMSIASLCAISLLKFDGKISNLSARSAASENDYKTIGKTWEKTFNTKKIAIKCDSDGKTLAEARKISDFLGKSGIADPSITYILPPIGVAEDNILRWKKYWTPEKLKLLRANLASAARSAGIKSDPLLKKIDEYFGEETSYNPKQIIGSGILKAWAVSTPDGISLALDVPLSKIGESSKFYDYIKRNFSGATYIDMEYFGTHISEKAKMWLIIFASLALVLVAAYLIIAMGGPMRAARVILPVLIGLTWALGALAALGIDINIVNVIFAIFAVCMAQDYAMFLSASKKADSSLAAVLLSAATTVCAFGTFAFAEHPLLKGLGLTAAISISSILAASILFFGLSLTEEK